jgi:hypothetical protein
MVTAKPPEDMEFQSEAELGFACGALVRQFSRQYWSATKVGTEGKDYLKHRVLTFGSDLSPDAVWKHALPGIFNVELKLDQIRLNDVFKRRIGVVLNECENRQEQIRGNRDGFMAAFWSGYALHNTDRSRQTNDDSNSPAAQGAPA